MNAVDACGSDVYCILRCLQNEVQIGYVDFRLNTDENEIYIEMIEVSPQYRRKGIATGMLNEIRSNYPNHYVDWGWTTEDGEYLKDKLTQDELNPEYIEIKNKLDEISKRLNELEGVLNNDAWLNNTSNEEIEQAGDEWELLYDRQRELQQELDDVRKYITVWK